jgi:hypothetical protein
MRLGRRNVIFSLDCGPIAFDELAESGLTAEICEWEENVWEDVESGMDSDEVETDVGDGPRGVQTNWSNIMATSVKGGVICDKAISPAARLKGKFGKGVGETNADEPVIIP